MNTTTDTRAFLDAILAHVEALADLLTVYQARAERAEEERDALAARVEELERALNPHRPLDIEAG